MIVITIRKKGPDNNYHIHNSSYHLCYSSHFPCNSGYPHILILLLSSFLEFLLIIEILAIYFTTHDKFFGAKNIIYWVNISHI